MKKLKEVKDVILKLPTLSKESIIGRLKISGFDTVTTYNPNKRDIYIHHKRKIVVKFPNIYSGDVYVDIKDIACPTEIISIGYNRYCFIQPFINDSHSDITNHPKFGEFDILVDSKLTDMHIGNFGIYRNKLVVHDW